jgi:hypothetical protein
MIGSDRDWVRSGGGIYIYIWLLPVATDGKMSMTGGRGAKL